MYTYHFIWAFSKIIFSFISYHMKSSIISYICQIQIFSSTRKYLHFLFQLYSNCFSMCIIESEFFSQKNLQFYKLSCYPQFYHIYDRSNFSILNENVSSSLLDYILIGFVWLPLYLWKLAQKFSIFKFFPMNFPYLKICYMKSSVLAENVSTSLFNCILIVFVCLSLYLRFFQKNLQFYELS